MRTVYRVTVAAVKYDDEGNFVADDTLFEATHHRPEALLRFAPGEVDDALRVVAGLGPTPSLDDLPTVPVPASAWDRAVEPQSVDAAAVQQPEAGAAATKRKRRTKAEIAADEAAAQLAAQQAGSATPDGPAPQAPEPVPAEMPPPVTVPPAAPVAAPDPVPAAAPQAPSGDGQPWNPFLAR